MILCLIIEIRRRNILRKVDCKLERRSIIAFIFYALFYAFILAPSCLMGYIKELVNVKKEWYKEKRRSEEVDKLLSTF